MELPPLLLAPSDLTRCLSAALAVLGWRGGPDDLLAALPHAQAQIDVTDLRNALAILGYPTRLAQLRRTAIHPRLLPALLLQPGRPAAVLYLDPTGAMLRFDGGTGQVAPCGPDGLRGTLVHFTEIEPAPRQNWFAAIARRFTGDLPGLLGASALIALLGLGVPLFTMHVFDTVIAGNSPASLPMLAGGALAALLFEILFRMLRQRALLRIGERLDRLVSAGVFSQLMALPTALVERAGTASQVSRLRDFATIRDFLTGSFALAALDLPFTLLVLVLMVALGGWVAIVPLGTAAALGLLFLLSRGAVRRAISAAAQAAQARDALAVEALEAAQTLKNAAAEERWIGRYAAAAARAAQASARVATLTGLVTVVSQALMTGSGLAAVVVGAVAVLHGGMSAGSLIAGMMLLWRVLGPLQTGFAMLSRWEQTQASIRQVDSLMALETERPAAAEARMAPPEAGAISFQRVTLRYLPQSEPVLAGASLTIRPGEVVAVTGGDGAGKSSVLRLVAGLYRPQGGLVRIDGHDVRAFDPAVLRRSIGWVPQAPEMLYGTIAQNLRLAHPTAEDDQLRRAAREARVLAAIEMLPEGFDTRVGDNLSTRLPRSILLRIALARALLRDAPILLLDEPATGLDDVCAEAFAEVVKARRGRCTILMATHRPSHMLLADRVLRLRDGQIEEAPPRPGPPQPMLRVPVFPPEAAASVFPVRAGASA
ncbi:peptidase domain-containing ABC transporter [Belnapia moabensis]|uniref:peptidase domain-containing ABC transporter n=1 Tax=Belnapia moabensis TaxID=365533 RepID=UPI00147019A9|nr:ABC transporter transmembrane domain-containing protein [Belnapia moabensis]